MNNFAIIMDGAIFENLDTASLTTMLHNVTIGGVDFDLEGYGGQECKEYSSLKQRLLDTLIAIIISILSIVISRKLSTDRENSFQESGENVGQKTEEHNEAFRTILLLLYTIVNGVELGYKVVRFKHNLR